MDDDVLDNDIKTILVCGPEASGSKLVTTMLLQAGGEVIHRSFPHGGERPGGEQWPDLTKLKIKWVVVTNRDWHSMVQAQLTSHVHDYHTAARNIQEAYRKIWSQIDIMGRKAYPITYESLIMYGTKALQPLCELFGLDVSNITEEIGDANDKYYGGNHFTDNTAVKDRTGTQFFTEPKSY